MAHKIFVTRKIPESGLQLLHDEGYEIDVSQKDGVLTKEELIAALKAKQYDAVLCLLTDKIDKEVLESAGQCKIFANYAVGFDNIDLAAARELNILVTNTPDVLTETVAEHTFALLLAIAHRIAEADRFTRAGKYTGWAPLMLLGADMSKKTLGIVGLGRIGMRVAKHAAEGFDMPVLYYDVNRNEEFEQKYKATFKPTVEEVLAESDFVSIHVPLLPSTRHLINDTRFSVMKPTAYLVNTSRGPIVEEFALVRALRDKKIAGAALDVFEAEPKIDPQLFELENVILTPHIASATLETRERMSTVAAKNIVEALSGRIPPNVVTLK